MPRLIHERQCPVCLVDFTTTDKRKKYCGRPCLHRHLAVLFSDRVTMQCISCGKDYLQKPSVVAISKFCSKPCKARHRTTVGIKNVACGVCGQVTQRRASRLGEFCSYRCLGVSKRKRATKACLICGKSFWLIQSHANVDNCCSYKCSHEWRRRNQTILTCVHCGTEYAAAPSRVARGSSFCSKQCLHKHNGPTSIERLAYDALHELGISFVPEYQVGRFWIDAFLPDLKLAIEIDGDYWHDRPDQIERDARKNNFLLSKGIGVVRILGSELLSSRSVIDLVETKINSIGSG